MVSQDYSIKWWEGESYEMERIQSKNLGMLPFGMSLSVLRWIMIHRQPCVGV